MDHELKAILGIAIAILIVVAAIFIFQYFWNPFAKPVVSSYSTGSVRDFNVDDKRALSGFFPESQKKFSNYFPEAQKKFGTRSTYEVNVREPFETTAPRYKSASIKPFGL